MSTESNAGRPSEFKSEYAQKLLDYFSRPPINPETNNVNDFPSLAGFAISIGVHRDTLLEWSKKTDPEFAEFSGAYKRVIDFQENYLVTLGLQGKVNTAFGIFTAKNVLKWRDKQPDETDVVVNNNITTLSDAEIDAKLEKLKGEKK